MSAKFITTVLTISATIAALSTTQVRASDADDIARFFGTAATLFILSKALDGRADAHVSVGSVGHVTPRIVNRHASPKVTKTVAKRPLPRVCLREVKGAPTKYVMSKSCLNKNYRKASALPRSCRIDVRNKNKVYNVFSVRCLRGKGYTLASR